MDFHHFGVACENIKDTIAYIEALWSEVLVSEVVWDKNQEASLCMITRKDGVNIELVQGRVVQSFLKKRQYLYHTCYEVDKLDKAMEQLEAAGDFLVSEPKEAVLFEGRRVAFFMGKMGLVELLER